MNLKEKSKKIAVFSLAYHPLVGGAELAVKEITDRIPDKNFYCFTHRFNNNWPERERVGNVEVLRVGHPKFLQKILYIFRAWRAAEGEHRKSPFDAIWGVMAAYAGIAALLFKLRHPKIPFLLTLQEGDSENHILRRVGIFYPLWRLVFKKADRIQVISNFLADFARRHGARCPIEVVPNGVDITKFQIPKSKSQINSKFQNPKIIITTSRLVYKNGIDTLIRAMAVIASEAKQSSGDRHGLRPRDDIKLQILGSGPDEQKLKNLAAKLGIADKVEFLGHVEPDQIPSYLLQATIFVRPSRSEGLGNSFLEAMAMGLPIIGTPVGGIVDFLKDRETGLFTKVDDPKDLAEKIDFLLTDEKTRSIIARNGQKLVLGHHSWDLISQKMDKIFHSIIHDSRFVIRILVATGLYPPEIGGPATYTALLEDELPKFGISVAVLPFRIVRQWPPLIRHLFYFFVCFFKALKADLIYAQDPVSVGLPAMFAAAISRRQFLIRVAGDYAWEQSVQHFNVKDSIDDFQNKKYGFRTELLKTVQKFVVNRADKVITPSAYFKNLVSRWSKNPDKVITIYNGIKLAVSSKQQVVSSKTILSAGRLVPWKGFGVLIEMMKDLPDWKLIVVGDGPERENLEARIQKLELQDRVRLAGAVPREELLELLHSATVFVLNTSFESFSFQVVEAMNAGVPVITTDVCDLGEIIENGKEGILVEPNNKGEILSALKKISEDRDFREKIVRNAQAKAQKFSVEKTAEKLSEIIKCFQPSRK